MPPPEALSVDVVIVAYNRFDLTESCLRHLAAQTRPHRVILVDNGSTDETPERLAGEWPDVTTVRLPENSGFPEACNVGVDAGEGDVVILLNNDVDCRPDFVERAVAPLEADPGLGSVAALSVMPGEERIDSIGMSVDPTLAGFLRLHGRPVSEAGSIEPALLGPAGAVAVYRRAAWEQAGGLDERIFAYGEDLDLALRVRAAGWGTVAATDAVGVHLGSATHGHRSAWQREHGGFQRGYLLRRYGIMRGRHALRALLTDIVVVLGDLAISRDLAALRGRIRGWRAGAGLPRHALPPGEGIAGEISFAESLRLRRGAYAKQAS